MPRRTEDEQVSRGPQPGRGRRGRSTSTSAFGVGRRESHDASDFYARFQPKELSGDDDVADPVDLAEPLVCGDSRSMDLLPDNGVALVVTSPPYFAGKEYEEALGEGTIPATYAEYLAMLRDVFAECMRVLEPGGRIAVNVANLGRKPYRSLAADIIRILDDDLGMLLRGEVVWVKAEGASGSCAWGSYRSPTNPVLRDVTERIVIASKGRFDRALDADQRRDRGLPYEPSVSTDEFLEATLDLWRIPAESARRIGHPAPFPVELPQRLIELYTFRGDIVLDPFLGSGSTAVAAVRAGRRYVGYDTDAGYVELARRRVADARARATGSNTRRHGRAGGAHEASDGTAGDPASDSTISNPTGSGAASDGDTGSGTAGPAEHGKAAQALAADLVERAGFRIVERNRKVPGLGFGISLVTRDAVDEEWCFDVTGAFTSIRSGLQRADTLWKCLGRANVLSATGTAPLVLLSTDLPPRRSTGDRALRAVGPSGVHDVMNMTDPEDLARLAKYAGGGHRGRALPGFWSEAELGSAR